MRLQAEVQLSVSCVWDPALLPEFAIDDDGDDDDVGEEDDYEDDDDEEFDGDYDNKPTICVWDPVLLPEFAIHPGLIIMIIIMKEGWLSWLCW